MENETDDQPVPNKFHLSDVNLVDLRNDNDEESSYFNGISAEESVVESKIVKPEILADAFVRKVVKDEDISSEKKESDKKFKEYIQERSSTSNQEGNYNTAILEEDDDEAAKEEDIPKTFNRMVKKFTIESDIEEVDEEMKETEISITENLQQAERAKMPLVSATKMISTEELLIKGKSKMTRRPASTLEQRLKIIFSLKDLLEERKKFRLKNRFLNEKCCKYLNKIAAVNYFESTDGALPIHGDQRYYDVLEEFMEMKVHYDNTKPSLEEETQNLTDSYYICRTRLDQVFEDFMSRELEVGSECIVGKFGKLLNEQKLHTLVKKQQRKFDELAEVRVHYLKFHNRLDSILKNLRALNLMGEGHSLMEYDHLVIINNSFMDKLDERKEEIQKLRNKCAEDFAILSHMKETSEAWAHDIIDAAVELEKVTNKKNEARKLLAVQRLKRDSLRKDILKIHFATGLLTSPRLLRKMEVNSQTLAVLKRKVDRLRRSTGISMKRDNAVAKSKTNGKSCHTENQNIPS